MAASEQKMVKLAEYVDEANSERMANVQRLANTMLEAAHDLQIQIEELAARLRREEND